jgi:excisionase family DNA binding protein
MTDLLTTAQVADLRGVSVRTIHRLVADHKLTPAVKLPGGTGAYLFHRDDVEALDIKRGAA